MPTSARDRLLHILDRISQIDDLWRGTSFAEATRDKTRWAAFERHLEVISEASRGIPPTWKDKHGTAVPWPKVAGLGSMLRHVYQHIDGDILWDIYEHDLSPLQEAVAAMIADRSPDP